MQMIRRLIAVAVAALFVGNASAQEAEQKIATVDMQQLFKAYYKTAEVQEALNVRQEKIKKLHEEKSAPIRKLVSELEQLKKESQDTSLSEVKQLAAYQAHQTKFNQGVQMEREREEFIQRRLRALNEVSAQRMREILGEIRTIVEEYSKAEGYDQVIDKTASSTSQINVLLYSKDASDITAALLKNINKNKPATPEKSATPSDSPAVPSAEQ
jgi:Skp family chaperone for outer membrane proteins